jgi:N,N-dimethylformamidase beta subunit-like, C-terminal/FlgD Ig-like domain
MRRLPVAAFGALVVATVGAFFVTQHVKVSSPLVNGASRSRGAFSPLHGGVCGLFDARVVSFSFYLQHRSDDVDVFVTDQSGNIVRTLATGKHMLGGTHAVRAHFLWDGYQDNHKVAPDGIYYFRVALLGQGPTINETALPVIVKSSLPHPVVRGVSPSVAAPGEPVTINYTDSHRSGNVLIYRTDRPNWWQHPLSSIATKWNHNSIVWNGRISGRPAPPGTYLFGFTMTDGACNPGRFPARLPPTRGTTPGAGVTLRYLAAEPPLAPVAAGSRALVEVDSRTRPYSWTLHRAGVRRALAHGTGLGHALAVRIPRQDGPGLYVVSLRSGAHETAVPLVAHSGTPAGAHARLLVVLPALTWQAVNPVDDDGDGIPNTLATGGPIRLARPLANGLPAGVADEATLLAYLDRSHLAYDLTTDIGLAAGIGPTLSGHRGVVLAGDETWVPGQLTALLRAFVQNGGNVLTLGIDSLRRTVTVHSDIARDPSDVAPTDIFGARIGPVAPRGGGLILVLKDGLGIFTTTSRAFPGFQSFQPIDVPSQAAGGSGTAGSGPAGAGSAVSAAGTSNSTQSIVGFKVGRGTVVEIGLPRFAASLAPGARNVDAQELVRRLWAVLGR